MTLLHETHRDSDHIKQGLGVSFVLGVVILALMLAVWVFFYLESMPLDAASTSLVALICAVVVLSVKWVWLYVRRKRV